MLFNAYKLPSRKAYTTIITVCKIVPLPSRHNSFIHAFIHSLTPSFIHQTPLESQYMPNTALGAPRGHCAPEN